MIDLLRAVGWFIDHHPVKYFFIILSAAVLYIHFTDAEHVYTPYELEIQAMTDEVVRMYDVCDAQGKDIGFDYTGKGEIVCRVRQDR